MRRQLHNQKSRPRETLDGRRGNNYNLCLLPCHGDADGFFWLNEVIKAYRVLGNSELDPLDLARKLVPSRSVVRRDGRSRVDAHVATIVSREDHRRRSSNLAFADFLAIHEQRSEEHTSEV